MPGKPTTARTPSPPSPASPRSPASPANTAPCTSGGPATSASAPPSPPSPTTAGTPAPGPPRSTSGPATAATTTRTRPACSPAPGSASSTAAGATTSPTTPPATATRQRSPDHPRRPDPRPFFRPSSARFRPAARGAVSTWSARSAARTNDVDPKRAPRRLHRRGRPITAGVDTEGVTTTPRVILGKPDAPGAWMRTSRRNRCPGSFVGGRPWERLVHCVDPGDGVAERVEQLRRVLRTHIRCPQGVLGVEDREDGVAQVVVDGSGGAYHSPPW